ncbi:MFS transporter [Nesterenkonia xinjiangensis]|uniref:DHA2 family multidrug resistance protein-like MFS transporter n=1 Tax=Nesterenkonia xinjiangensis TaxID=225327 RepID=A0A7Z0GM69_9MICC|nr:MFS transporter [Nesterenkonia xinjiangensis]NYJ77731.1 DHA2 family multidrug resistance protein-like MFS transporter [Nesterenkonia xinjiangensis]
MATASLPLVDPGPVPQLSRWQRWTVLVIVSSALLLITLDNTVLYTALPRLTEDLGASTSQSLWIINAYPLVIAGLLPGSGALGDRLGHKRLFQYGLVIFGVASLAAAFSLTPEALIAARAFLAVGAAAMMPATLALIRVSFPMEKERNLAIAVWASVSVVGMAIGPIVGGLLLERFWWGSVFLINVPIAVAGSLAIILAGPRNLTNPAKRWDGLSSAQVMIGLTAAVLAIKSLAEDGVDWLLVIGSALVAVVALTVFGRRQARLEEPLIDFTIFRNRAFAAGVAAAGASIFAIMGTQLASTQRFQLVEGYTPLQAGLLVSAIAVGALPMALIGGAILHRTGLLVLISGGLSVAALGAGVSVAGAAQDMLSVLVLGLLIMGVGLGGSISVASTAIMGNVPPRRAGMAASIEEVSYEFGGLVAVATLGSLLNFAYFRFLTLPAGADRFTGASPTEALTSGEGDVVAAASQAMDSSFLVVLAAVTAVLAAGTLITGSLLRRHLPGTASQAYPGNH